MKIIQNSINMEVSVIGSGNIDIIAQGVNKKVFEIGSMPVESTKLSFGGDGLNESIILSRLGIDTELISTIGNDEAGKKILSYLKENNVNTTKVKVKEDLITGINIVLVDEKGERFFLTNPNANFRKLSLSDIKPYIDSLSNVVSFAGIFISRDLKINDIKEMFSLIKQRDRILCVDMTKRKNNETIEDIKPLLPYIDYIFPNEEEIELLTGINNPCENAKILVDNGVKCAVIKLGQKGCFVKTKVEEFFVPAYKVKNVVDTTGAGDNFVAGFLYGIYNGFTVKNCAEFANATAAISVEHIGATTGVNCMSDILDRMNNIN